LESIADQFMIGAHIMAAPFLDPDATERDVVLPAGWWYDLARGEWVAGGTTITVQRTDVPVLFVRDGAIIPTLVGKQFTPQLDFSRVEFHVFAKERDAELLYHEDDGETRAWREGAVTTTRLHYLPTTRELAVERAASGYYDA